MTFNGIVLDVDGTLVDSNEAHVQSWVQAITEAGYQTSEEKIRKLIGMGGDNLLPAAIQVEKDTDTGKKLSERRKEIFQSRYLPHLKPFPHIRDLVAQMHRDGFKLVVASSGEPEEVERMLEIAGVTEFIQEMTSSGDVKNSKPDPDTIQAALTKLDEDSQNIVMLGDTPYDIEAAAKTGVKVIALRCGGFTDEELHGALAVYDDPADLLRQYEQSALRMK